MRVLIIFPVRLLLLAVTCGSAWCSALSHCSARPVMVQRLRWTFARPRRHLRAVAPL